MHKKDDYVNYLHEKIDEWDEKIEVLKARLDTLEEDSREELEKNIKFLSQKRDEVEKKSKEIAGRGTDAWQDIKAGLELAEESIITSLQSALSRFTK